MTKPEHDLLVAMAEVVAATHSWVNRDPGPSRLYINLKKAIDTVRKAETD